jgi:hypothetical protein
MTSIKWPYYAVFGDCAIGECHYEHFIGVYRSLDVAYTMLRKYAAFTGQPKQPKPILIHVDVTNGDMPLDNVEPIPTLLLKDGMIADDQGFRVLR